MRKTGLLIFIFLIVQLSGNSQPGDSCNSCQLENLNQEIDQLVVRKNLDSLKKLYADDFVFSHGSGKVEGKDGWMQTVGRSNYPVRDHDSVRVELHENIGIVKGKMFIRKINKDKTDTYHLRYIRIYAKRNGQWVLISHNTTHEWHE